LYIFDAPRNKSIIIHKRKQEMKVLVTGGAGYIGSVLVRLLLDKGYNVRVLDSLKFSGDALYDVVQHPNFEFQKGDIRNANDVEKAIKGVDAIAHLAQLLEIQHVRNFRMKRTKRIGMDRLPYLKLQKKAE
jgi:nucleoside-diphosphate-sugar epimerase